MQKRFRKVLNIIWYVIVCGFLCLGIWLSYGAWCVGQHELLPRVNAKGVSGVWVQASDAQIHLQMWGNPLHQPLLLIHGTGAWAETWRNNVQAMVDAGFYVVAMDLPPFGYSTLPNQANYSRVAQADRINTVINSLGAQPVRLLAHSFGAGPAVEAVMRQSKRVEQLILVDAALGLSSMSSQTCVKNSYWMDLWSWRTWRTWGHVLDFV